MTSTAQVPRTAFSSREGIVIARLGFSCMVAALLSGVLQGVWELAQPILTNPQTFASTAPVQLWSHSLLEVIKTAGFLAGLFGFYLRATRRGPVMKVFMGLAVAGGLFYAGVWLWLAATTRFTIVYVLGGMWYQMVAPVALGIAALFARRIFWANGAWAIIVGVLNSQIFPLLGPARALIVQGVIWLVFGYIVYARRAHSPPPSSLS